MQKLVEIGSDIGPQAIRAQVARILASEGFGRSTRMQRFLVFVVEETLAGRADQLGEYAIGVSVFDRGEDFEPAVDPIVRNDARRLRQKLGEYYRAATYAADRVLIDVPKGGYVPVFAPMSNPADKQAVSSDAPCRLAVLPFDVISVVPESWNLGRALCLSLTASLTDLEGVQAIAHGYVQHYREAAEQLKASHVIQGSVLEFDYRYRVIVNLIQVTDGTQLWARSYEFGRNEIFNVQSEVVGAVIDEVSARLGTQRPRALSFAAAA